MRVTGWTPAVLRAQPASVIRAHFARIFAGLAWSPELAAAANRPTPGPVGVRQSRRLRGGPHRARQGTGGAAMLTAALLAGGRIDG